MKKAIRKKILSKRDQIPHAIKAEKDLLIRNSLYTLSEFLDAKKILFYASFRSEVETHSMIKQTLKTGKNLILPRVYKKGHRLLLYELKDMKELNAGFMGIPEPFVPDERIVSIDDIDLVIIPGAAFDYSGNRLGYGAGYYDSLLAERKKKIPVIAIAYEEQIVDSITPEEHDVKVDIIVTDKRVIRIS
ncbi:MAG: 5-formyltetrahydrofolate cyclo-ligase [Nitrospira sp.]|nr:5-formyltetrahydrofolate cyclo-ligase [Nitrospira sp.]